MSISGSFENVVKSAGEEMRAALSDQRAASASQTQVMVEALANQAERAAQVNSQQVASALEAVLDQSKEALSEMGRQFQTSLQEVRRQSTESRDMTITALNTRNREHLHTWRGFCWSAIAFALALGIILAVSLFSRADIQSHLDDANKQVSAQKTQIDSQDAQLGFYQRHWNYHFSEQVPPEANQTFGGVVPVGKILVLMGHNVDVHFALPDQRAQWFIVSGWDAVSFPSGTMIYSITADAALQGGYIPAADAQSAYCSALAKSAGYKETSFHTPMAAC